MKRYLALALLLVSLLAAQPAAHAHYIWATIADHKVRFALLESLTESPNPQFAKYAENLAPQSDGIPLTLGERRDGASYAALSPTQTLVTADSIVGTRQRDGSAEYLLIYHAKGAATLTDAARDVHQPQEIRARLSDDALLISIYSNGKPVPNNEVTVERPGAEPTTVKTDANGIASLKWPQPTTPGFVGIRTMINEPKIGELAGTKYTEVHHWVTLTFPAIGPEPNP